jgi:hypothetical protein
MVRALPVPPLNAYLAGYGTAFTFTLTFERSQTEIVLWAKIIILKEKESRV